MEMTSEGAAGATGAVHNMDFLKETLEDLERRGLKRRLRFLESAQGREVVMDGRRVINFCSNDYLGLAGDPRLKEAAADAMNREGFGSGASRLVCGSLPSHRVLEEKIARFKGTEAALVFSTGYMANVGIISSLFGPHDVIFADRLNHASIVDGILMSRAAFRRYPHRDMAALEKMLEAAPGAAKKAVITDSVFSMDGDIAPLDKIVALARRYEALVMVDEAHATGVFGHGGRGVVEHFSLEGKVDVVMGTLSKAVGSFGAFCCGPRTLIEYLVNRARSFIYTTALPPAVAAASLQGITIIEQEPVRRRQLWENARFVLDGLRQKGFDTLDSASPIIPVVLGDAGAAVRFSERLFEKGILASAIRPPTVPEKTARVRLTVSAAHTREDLEYLLEQMEKIGR